MDKARYKKYREVSIDGCKLTGRGFKNAQGEKTTDTGSSRATMMVSPSGFAINLVKHIK